MAITLRVMKALAVKSLWAGSKASIAIIILGRLLFFAGSLLAQEPPPIVLETTGECSKSLRTVDEWLQEFITKHEIPGGSFAVAVNGEIKLARGYGYANRETKQVVKPDTLFRIASVSKPITAIAIMRLVQEGKLKISDTIMDVLNMRHWAGDMKDYDPWWNEVTIEQLLTHTAGWDRERSGDPMFMDFRIRDEVTKSLPITPRDVIRFQFLRPFDDAPGDRYAYSNFGYSMLGRVIEERSGQSYENYVREQIFAPIGITSARIGGSRQGQRFENESIYYTSNGETAIAVTGQGAGEEEVALEYGGWNQELIDAHGGWVMSSVDLVRLGMALDSPDGPLTAASVAEMFKPRVSMAHPPRDGLPRYGYGWISGTLADGSPIVVHNGALPCTAAVLARIDDNVWFAALFNLGRRDGKWLASGLDQELGRLIRASIAK